jgi:hypothetical protein
MVRDGVAARPGYQCRQPCQQLDGLKNEGARTIGPTLLELQQQYTVASLLKAAFW